MKHFKYKKLKNKTLILGFSIFFSILLTSAYFKGTAFASGGGLRTLATSQQNNGSATFDTQSGCQPNNPSGSPHCCGQGTNAIETSIDFGCTGKGNPILDMTFAIIRFLSAGVGVVVVFSTILAGIQYTVSRDNPESTQKAKGRLVSNVIALAVFIFAYSIMNFLIPGGFFNG